MPWLNYHSHSLFCDGKAAPEEFVLAALDKGFPAWGFSSHAPVPFASPWNIPADRLDAYFAEIERLRKAYADRIEIYTGLEVDYLGNGRDYSVKALRDAGIDFVIGSVHYIGYFADGRGFCFDGQPADFFRGVEELYGNDFRPVISGYFERVRQMMDIDRPDVVGHFDKIKMHTTVRPYINEDDPLYWKEVEESLDLMAETGCILEVNTRGLYKHNPPLLYPSAGILESAFRRDIPVMMNSDSHHPDEIDSGFADTAALLRQIGYRSVRVLLNGNWQDRGFTPAGIEV